MAWVINNKTSKLGPGIKELFSYKDLLIRLVRTDLVASYQQTVLGPLWILLHPFLMLITYYLVFYKVARMPTGGVPPELFYLCGILLWNFFSEIFIGTANTFNKNAHLFSKIYFPRIISPIAITLLQFYHLLVQLALLAIFLVYYNAVGMFKYAGNGMMLALPTIILTAGYGFALGIFFSVLSSKYRDFLTLIPVLLRVTMIVCPIFYSIDFVPTDMKWIVKYNPLSYLFEYFRFSILGIGQLSYFGFFFSWSFMLVLLFSGIVVFNKTSNRILDVL